MMSVVNGYLRSETALGAAGGEGGIRTLEGGFAPLHDFQSCSFGQLGHLSVAQAVSQLNAVIGAMLLLGR